jgi:hypothetical protein
MGNQLQEAKHSKYGKNGSQPQVVGFKKGFGPFVDRIQKVTNNGGDTG